MVGKRFEEIPPFFWKLPAFLCILGEAVFFQFCARQSPRLDPGAEVLREALLTNLTGTPQSARNRPSALPELIFNLEEGEGAFRTQVKAVSFEMWADFSFGRQNLSGPDDFDLGFRRYTVRTNGGLTNPSRFGAACKSTTKVFPNSSTTSVSIGCSSSQFQEDRISQAEVAGGGGVEFVGSDVLSNFGNGWFTYDLPFLRPTFDVFVIRSHDAQRYYAVQIVNYYSDAGTSAYLTFRWRLIPFE